MNTKYEITVHHIRFLADAIEDEKLRGYVQQVILDWDKGNIQISLPESLPKVWSLVERLLLEIYTLQNRGSK